MVVEISEEERVLEELCVVWIPCELSLDVSEACDGLLGGSEHPGSVNCKEYL